VSTPPPSLVSSANWLRVRSNSSSRSLVKKLNKAGPSTDPYTPPNPETPPYKGRAEMFSLKHPANLQKEWGELEVSTQQGCHRPGRSGCGTGASQAGTTVLAGPAPAGRILPVQPASTPALPPPPSSHPAGSHPTRGLRRDGKGGSNQSGRGEEPVCRACPWTCAGWLCTAGPGRGDIVGDSHHQPQKLETRTPTAAPLTASCRPGPRYPITPTAAPPRPMGSHCFIRPGKLSWPGQDPSPAQSFPRQRGSGYGRGEAKGWICAPGARFHLDGGSPKGTPLSPRSPGEQSPRQAPASPAHAPRRGRTAEAAHGNHPWGTLTGTHLCSLPEWRRGQPPPPRSPPSNRSRWLSARKSHLGGSPAPAPLSRDRSTPKPFLPRRDSLAKQSPMSTPTTHTHLEPGAASEPGDTGKGTETETSAASTACVYLL